MTIENEETADCAGCSTAVALGSVIELSSGNYCNDCAVSCWDCTQFFHVNSGSPHANVGDYLVCGRCTRNNWFTCNNCGEWVSCDSDYISVSYERWCEDCGMNETYWCDYCDSRHINDYTCHPNNIMEYGFRPVPNFLMLDDEAARARTIHTENNRVSRSYLQIPFMGFELEVESESGDLASAAQLFADYDRNQEIVYLKHDGSLHHGFEIVTHPMTLGWVNDPDSSGKFWEVIGKLSACNMSGWNADSAGMHVHVSRDGFSSDTHQAKFITFVVNNREFMEFMAGRSGSHWSSFDREQLRNLRSKIRRQSHTDRYQAVNVQNKATLEVRIFQSTVTVERVKANLQLVHAMVSYTDTITTNQVITTNALSYPYLVEFVRGKSEYAELNTYLDNWLEKFESRRMTGEW